MTNKNAKNFNEMKHKKNNLIENLKKNISVLNELSESSQLPMELTNILNQVEKMSIEHFRPQVEVLTGNALSPEEILEKIKETTGYTKWTLEIIPEQDREWSKKDFEAHFAVSTTEYSTYLITRHTKNRDDVFLIEVTVLNGCFYISFATDRVGWNRDKLIPNKQFDSIIDIEVC